jgi:hypothetical protein
VTPAEIIERIFTTENPATGSRPPAQIAWVVFEHGTAFFTAPTDALGADASFDALADAARAALRELGPVGVGSASADFRTSRLDGWFPDAPIWFVSFDHPAIATVIESEGGDLEIGLMARSLRQQDHDEPTIALVRRFDGATRAA